MTQIAILTDSSAYLAPDLVQQHNIEVIPLKIHWGDETFRDGVDITSAEFYKRLATCSALPTTSQPCTYEFIQAFDKLVSNVFIQATRSFNPHAAGFCILSRRQTHEKIGGFDETLYLSEDHDYVRRAAAQGCRFGILHMPIPVSVRRLEEDGRLNVAVRYSFLALNQIMGDPLDQALLDRYLGEYRFGQH